MCSHEKIKTLLTAGNEDKIKIELQSYDLLKRDSKGYTILHVLVEYKAVKYLSYCIENLNPDLTLKDLNGYTPLSLARYLGDFKGILSSEASKSMTEILENAENRFEENRQL